MQWKHANWKFRTQPSDGKVMATIFLDCKGVLLMDYLPHKTTMTGPYYSELMKKLLQTVKGKRRGMLTRCHCCSTTMHRRTRLELQEPYSEGHRS